MYSEQQIQVSDLTCDGVSLAGGERGMMRDEQCENAVSLMSGAMGHEEREGKAQDE